MTVVVGIASRQGPEDNPILKRCLDSLMKWDPGVTFEARVEIGEPFTKGEKRQRIISFAKARNATHACVLEDDTEIMEDGWLAALMTPALSDPIVGMVNPLETKDAPPGFPEQGRGKIVDGTNLFGFCILYALDWEPTYNPRIKWLDDLYMSLLCRTKGRRLVLCGHTTVKHTKAPFMDDDKPPWEQGDRKRFGEKSSYYHAERHMEERLLEASYLINVFGEMASHTVPAELMEELWRRSKAAEGSSAQRASS